MSQKLSTQLEIISDKYSDVRQTDEETIEKSEINNKISLKKEKK